MKGASKLKKLIVLFFMFVIPQWLLANNSNPVCRVTLKHISINLILSDTLPPKKSTAGTNEKAEEEIIKIVPKAHKQPVPIPVTVNVKPVIIIKPKIIQPIIKPIIKVLH